MPDHETEIWTESTDHRTVTFRNLTDEWIELRSQLVIGPDDGSSKVSVTSKREIPPRKNIDWMFLGGTLDYDGQHLPPELLILLPDSYGISRRNNYFWQATTIDHRNRDKICESCENYVQTYCQSLKSNMPTLEIVDSECCVSSNVLRLDDLPDLFPNKPEEASIRRKGASTLQTLSALTVIDRCGIRNANMIDKLPLPEPILTKLKKFLKQE